MQEGIHVGGGGDKFHVLTTFPINFTSCGLTKHTGIYIYVYIFINI